MVDSNVVLLAAEGGGQSNFLIPNGTFIFVLLIFLIVLGVIAKWVVPPISRVLHEREAMVYKTAEDNKRAAQLRAAADADYRNVMADARREATTVREEARAEGRKIVDDARARANAEVSTLLQQANEQLTQQSRALTADLQSSVETLAANLASRVLGVDVATRTVPVATGRER
ncbi:ATP synthase F0F1 subunit B [Mycolicibacterium novocastrense]|uniref:ATP synthase subunit b n=1 Tax=Mycolicibacterium novocastrense TaxID=59813 RepID=A0AAW5SDQ7_MYCNV|nr:F0F1 ATP synthase subunit B [Mycolicibacterium novocastrense]KUH73853.1 ATP synthase F0F1 subunit B [Mycolicibacterium novocastrense]KUH74578.1 ATP synthase F0F1 subunit B [Mycolicibacterium novocastrense]KUH75628.1 ATP synthase F0F1 subunit B [Mycolicibacterium novocastrense]MCV7022121.1 F0F1 ATP synthase subunit B [Mycolicibacterium novocastrense]GAT09400.1 F0F1 ATP synthase subunit B [Mycolicibacterium novocastrense]